MSRQKLAYVGAGVIAVGLFLFLAPVLNPFQFGMDICPHSLLSANVFVRVSVTYLSFRFGGVYWGGVGYNFYTGYFC